MRDLLRRLKADERGVTAIEYCVLIAFLALAINVTMANLGIRLDQGFQHISNALSDGSAPAASSGPTQAQSQSQ